MKNNHQLTSSQAQRTQHSTAQKVAHQVTVSPAQVRIIL